jgi:hypothetical protein
MATLQENLAAAQDAVSYANARMWRGASNRPEGARQWIRASACMFPTRVLRQTTAAQDAADEHALQTLDQLPQILALGEAAEQRACGNCGEMAAVAFRRLFMRRVEPIDYLFGTNFDHSFVVVGRTAVPGMPGRQQMEPANWGPVAVVCDPHQRAAYPASEIRRRMRPPNAEFDIIARHPRGAPTWTASRPMPSLRRPALGGR